MTKVYNRYENGTLNLSGVTLETNSSYAEDKLKGSDGYIYTKLGINTYYAYGADYVLLEDFKTTPVSETILNVGDIVSIYGEEVEVLLVHDEDFAYIDEEEGLMVNSIGGIDEINSSEVPYEQKDLPTLEEYVDKASWVEFNEPLCNLDPVDVVTLISKYLELTKEQV